MRRPVRKQSLPPGFSFTRNERPQKPLQGSEGMARERPGQRAEREPQCTERTGSGNGPCVSTKRKNEGAAQFRAGVSSLCGAAHASPQLGIFNNGAARSLATLSDHRDLMYTPIPSIMCATSISLLATRGSSRCRRVGPHDERKRKRPSSSATTMSPSRLFGALPTGSSSPTSLSIYPMADSNRLPGLPVCCAYQPTGLAVLS